jgi:hypothetical protein
MRREDKLFYLGVAAIITAIWAVLYFQWTVIFEACSENGWSMDKIVAAMVAISFFVVLFTLSWRVPEVAHLEHDHKQIKKAKR